MLQIYWNRIASFHWNARMYLLHTIIFGAALGVRRLLF